MIENTGLGTGETALAEDLDPVSSTTWWLTTVLTLVQGDLIPPSDLRLLHAHTTHTYTQAYMGKNKTKNSKKHSTKTPDNTPGMLSFICYIIRFPSSISVAVVKHLDTSNYEEVRVYLASRSQSIIAGKEPKAPSHIYCQEQRENECMYCP